MSELKYTECVAALADYKDISVVFERKEHVQIKIEKIKVENKKKELLLPMVTF